MRKYISSVCALLLLGCTKDFEKFNSNPYGATTEQMSTTALGGNQILNLQKLVVPQQENSYQMCFDLVATPFAGYAAQPNFQKDYASYNPRKGWTDYVFDDTFPKVNKEYFDLKSLAKGDINKDFFALGTVLRVAIMHWLTDCYGPLPYSKVAANQSKVAYDSGEELYINLCEDLKASIESLKKVDPNDRQYQDFDVVYSGDMTKWVKYASSLLLRISLRMSDVKPAQAKEYAEYALSQGVILSNDDNAKLATSDNATFKVAVSWSDSRAGADITEYMNAFSDPRREKFFSRVSGRTQPFFGLRSGKASVTADVGDYSVPNITANSPMIWMTAAEVAFIKAEGALKGWNVGDTAENLYKKGIELSFEQWGASLGNYLTDSSMRGNFTDEKKSAYDASFSSTITVNWADAAGNTEKQLAKIITQKWIAMYPYGSQEAWAEWRRTGYPNLMPIAENASGGVVSNITQVGGKDRGGMRRIPYSSKETSDNGANKNVAVGYLGGADNATTDLWWVRR